MPLTDTQITQAIDDRMRRWKGRLHEQRATPLLVLGLHADHAELTVQTCEGLSDAEILTMLEAAATLLRRGMHRTLSEPRFGNDRR